MQCLKTKDSSASFFQMYRESSLILEQFGPVKDKEHSDSAFLSQRLSVFMPICNYNCTMFDVIFSKTEYNEIEKASL